MSNFSWHNCGVPKKSNTATVGSRAESVIHTIFIATMLQCHNQYLFWHFGEKSLATVVAATKFFMCTHNTEYL